GDDLVRELAPLVQVCDDGGDRLAGEPLDRAPQLLLLVVEREVDHEGLTPSTGPGLRGTGWGGRAGGPSSGWRRRGRRGRRPSRCRGRAASTRGPRWGGCRW